MKTTTLGVNGPAVSTVGFGAWAIGGMNWGPTDDEVSKRALHAALDEGMTLIDTADVYGFGHSEELIAEVIAERRPEHLVIASKAGSDFYNAGASDDLGYGPIRQNYTRTYLVSAVEKSLQRLGVECIDILQLHSGDLENLERDDPWDALVQLKQAGKIRYAGWSVQSFQENAHAHLVDRHHELLDVLQVRYNLLERVAEEQLLPKAHAHGIGVIVRIPLLFGLLTGKFNQQSTFGDDDHRSMNLNAAKLAAYLDQLATLQPLFDRFPDETMAQVSLRFCITHSACHTVIPGAKTEAQVRDNGAASDLGPLPADALALIA